MMKFFAFFFLVLLSFSCQPTKPASSEKIVRINISSDPATVDPRKTRALNERILTCMLFDGLTRVSKEGKSSFALAKDVVISEDRTRYTFSLKEAFWSNGERVRPKDFVYAWQKALSPDFPSENAYQLFCIKNAREIKQGLKPCSELCALEVDENTLQIDLITPIPYFLELLSFSIFFPVHEKIDEGQMLSCGPFLLKEWKHNDYIEVVKNPYYWDAEHVLLPAVYMTMVSEDTEIRMFEQNELDWAGSPVSSLPIDLLLDLKKQGSLCSAPMLGTSFFRINVEAFPFHNSDIRKAFSLAINRKAIVEHVLQGDQKIALRLVPDSPLSYFNDADNKEAQALWQKGLEEMKLSSDQFPKITFLYASNQKNHLIAQAVQQDWKKVLGVEVILEAVEPKVYYSRIKKQDYEIASGSWIADYNDPESFLEVFKYKEASTNNTKWTSELYTAFLDEARVLQGAAREEKLLSCEAILMKEMPIIPIYHFNYLYVQNKELKEVVISPTGNIDFKWAYFENENIERN